jgi:hypothetical protein
VLLVVCPFHLGRGMLALLGRRGPVGEGIFLRIDLFGWTVSQEIVRRR